MLYRTCDNLEGFNLFILGNVTHLETPLTFCCIPRVTPPQLALADTPEAAMRDFMEFRASIISESVKFGMLDGQASDEEREYSKACTKCPHFLPYNVSTGPGGDGLIHRVNIGLYPSPCQCRCIYCKQGAGSDFNKYDKATCAPGYERVLSFLEYVVGKGLVAPDAQWEFTCGEITAHPHKNRFYELVKGRNTLFFTNCFIFDEKIGEHLASNPTSALFLSIDSGIPETWKKVKGVDNFDLVTDNLVKYFASSSRDGQIMLKYIILPGINDTLEDFRSLIEIMKLLKTDGLVISRENKAIVPEARQTEVTEEYRERELGAASYLLAMLLKNGLKAGNLWDYSQEERTKIAAFTQELLNTGRV